MTATVDHATTAKSGVLQHAATLADDDCTLCAGRGWAATLDADGHPDGGHICPCTVEPPDPSDHDAPR